MPQPICQPGMSYRSYPCHLLDRPQCAILIGAVAGEWGAIDGILAHIYGIISGGSDIIPVGVIGIDEMAREALGNVPALQLRLKLVRLALKRTMPEEIATQFNDISREIQSRSGERTNIIHGNWFVSKDLPESLALKQNDGTHIEYTESDFSDSLDRISETRRKLHRLSIVVGKTVVRQSEAHPQ